MTPLVKDCVEFGFVEVEVELLHDEAGKVDLPFAKADRLRVEWHEGRVRLQAGGFIGVVPVNQRLALRVEPRAPVGNLSEIVSRSGHRPLQIAMLRSYAPHGSAETWLYDAYVEYFVPAVADLLDHGLYRTYVRRYGSGSSPHGALDLAGTIRHFSARNIPYKADYSWFERTHDNPPNRLINAALQVLTNHFHSESRRSERGGEARARRIASLLPPFDNVSPLGDSALEEDPILSGRQPLPDARYYYREVMEAAKGLLSGTGVDLRSRSDGLLLPSLLIDMREVFEKYVRVVLQDDPDLADLGYSVLDGNADGTHSLYGEPTLRQQSLWGRGVARSQGIGPASTPDIVLLDRSGTTILVGEVKYTLPGLLPDRNEVEQAVTYASTHDCARVLLIHPAAGADAGLHFVGRVGRVEVFDYRFDLAARNLGDEGRAWGAAVRRILES